MGAPGSFQEAERNIARTARHIQQTLACARRQPIHHRIFPKTMYAPRHHIIHNIIFRGNAAKNTLHKIGFIRLRYGFKSEMGCGFALIIHRNCLCLNKLCYIAEQLEYNAALASLAIAFLQ